VIGEKQEEIKKRNWKNVEGEKHDQCVGEIVPSDLK
jgi:hypothetical protein